MTPRNPAPSLTPQKKVRDIVNHYFKLELEKNQNFREEASKELLKFFIETEDGSYTLKSDEIEGISETMHTHHGAISESMEKFVKPAKLENKKHIKVLDICCGLGYNAAALIEYLDLISQKDVKLELNMIEISPETLAASLLIPNPSNYHKIIQKAIENKLIHINFAKLHLVPFEIPENISFKIFIDDARKVVSTLKDDYYDTIFLDPFSPSKAPELYSVDFLKELKRVIKPDGILATYTSAAPVRMGLIESGLYTGEGPKFGRKSGGTIASLSPDKIEKNLDHNAERMIALSDAGIPFRDPSLSLSSGEILKNREMERKEVRGHTKFSSAVKTPIFLGNDIEMDRMGRRVSRNINKLKIDELKSKKALYLICPQNDSCICGCNEPRADNSRDRILKMVERLKKLSSKNFNSP